MVLAWKRWSKFLTKKLHEKEKFFRSNLEELLRFRLLKDHLVDVEKLLDENVPQGSLNKLINVEKRKKENAQEILTPNRRLKEVTAVKKWYSSKTHDLEEKKMQAVWKKAAETSNFGNREFTSYGNWGRFSVQLTSKNRKACTEFRNKDYAARTSLWLPENHNPDFEGLPAGVDVTHPPADQPDMEPNCWIIKLPGGGSHIKNQEAQVVYLNRKTEDILKKYRVMTLMKFKSIDPDGPFFINFRGQALGLMTNTKGSLWHKFKIATGLDSSSCNVIRRGAEAQVLNSPIAAARVKDLQSHSASTGHGAYDKTAPIFRSSFMNHLSKMEGSDKVVSGEQIKMTEEAKAMFVRVEEEDKETSIVEAEKVLEKGPTRRTFSKMQRILAEDRKLIQESFSNPSNKEIFEMTCGKKFPPAKAFKKIFYRAVDGDLLETLRPVEERVFKTIRLDVEKEHKCEWDGGKEMNRTADLKVAATVRNSLFAYEKNRSKKQRSYFKF